LKGLEASGIVKEKEHSTSPTDLLQTEETGLRPIDDIDQHVQDLSDRGLVEISSLSFLSPSGLPLA
jgi:hypothetical protein